MDALNAITEIAPPKILKKSSTKSSKDLQKPAAAVTILPLSNAVGPSQNPHVLGALECISYKWTGGNSCFFDVGLALWFEAFSRWPSDARSGLLTSLPNDSILASVFHHFDRRIKWLSTGAGGLIAGRRELALGQDVTRHAIFGRLKLYSKSSEYGCARTWLIQAVAVS